MCGGSTVRISIYRLGVARPAENWGRSEERETAKWFSGKLGRVVQPRVAPRK